MSNAMQTQPTNGSTAVAHRPTTIRGWLKNDGLKDEIARALPRHCSPDRMLRVTLTAMTRTPKLAECDTESFMQCLLSLSQWGLEPDGRNAHLIPFNNRKRGVVECQLILDYKGLVQLLYRSDQVLSVHADVVYEGDDFSFNMGQVTKHTPHWLRTDSRKPLERGEILAFYSRIEMKGAAVKCEVMSVDEVNAIRSRSKAGQSGPWVTDYIEMGKKTVFRRATKWLPLSAEIIGAFDKDYDAPAFSTEIRSASPATVAPASLNQLADERAAKTAEPDPMPTESTDVIEGVRQALAMAETAAQVKKIYDLHCGPESKLSDAQRDAVREICFARNDELSPAATVAADGELFEKGQKAPA